MRTDPCCVGKLLALVVIAMMIATNAEARLVKGYHHATIVRVVDGDTIRVLVPRWRNSPFARISIRVHGVDAPESLKVNAACEPERLLGLEAKAYLQTLLPPGQRLRFYYTGSDKYFRIGARVVLRDGSDLAEVMTGKGYAKPYTGKGQRPNWCTASTHDTSTGE